MESVFSWNSEKVWTPLFLEQTEVNQCYLNLGKSNSSLVSLLKQFFLLLLYLGHYIMCHKTDSLLPFIVFRSKKEILTLAGKKNISDKFYWIKKKATVWRLIDKNPESIFMKVFYVIGNFLHFLNLWQNNDVTFQDLK